MLGARTKGAHQREKRTFKGGLMKRNEFVYLLSSPFCCSERLLVKRLYGSKHPEQVESWEETKCMCKKKKKGGIKRTHIRIRLTAETSCSGGAPSCRTLSPEPIYLTLVRTNVSDCCSGYFRSQQVDRETWFHRSYHRQLYYKLHPPPFCLPTVVTSNKSNGISNHPERWLNLYLWNTTVWAGIYSI